jgi:hypothetical protein|tara:strand:+ start:827 stop:979 length:153 start_codon:yes stop_codon:yes gene_type:complete
MFDQSYDTPQIKESSEASAKDTGAIESNIEKHKAMAIMGLFIIFLSVQTT